MAKILIAEDEARISSFVTKGLTSAGFACSAVATAAEAIDLAHTGAFDLLVLDLGLPDADGFDVLARLRGEGNKIPVIILTARTSSRDVVSGLQNGADDYMTKPFGFDELLARVRLRIRPSDDAGTTQVLAHGSLRLDLRTRRADVGAGEVDLSAREFALAEVFWRHPGQVLSREQLLSSVWGYDFDPGSNVVDVYVRYLRQKLGATHFETVRGMGYRFVTRPTGAE